MASVLLMWSMMAIGASAKHYTVLTFGDSWGQIGPSWRVIRDVFRKHGVDVTVRSAAISGTTACQWAMDPASMVQMARLQFPTHLEGPDFVWYTAGGNDMIYNNSFADCTRNAKTIEEAEQCTDSTTQAVRSCTEKLFDRYWKSFPKSQIMQVNYDVPCENRACESMDAGFLGSFCGTNITCLNTMAVNWVNHYIGALAEKYPEPQYTAVHIEGTGQMVEGDVKAHVGVPDIDRSGVCDKMVACVHPLYGSKYATAIGDAWWDLFFSKYVTKDNSTVIV